MPAAPAPGTVAYNSLIPTMHQGIDRPTWSNLAYQTLASSIKRAAQTQTSIGMPSSWPYGPVTRAQLLADGSPGPVLDAQLIDWANKYAPQDTEMIDYFAQAGTPIGAPPAATANDYIDPRDPTGQNAALAKQQQDLQNAQRLLALSEFSGTGAKGGGVAGGTMRLTSSGSGSSGLSGSGSKTSLGSGYAYSPSGSVLDAADQARLAEQQREFDLSHELDVQRLGLTQQQLAQEARDRELARQQTRAGTLADLTARGGGDAVQRELYLRGQPEPVGTPVDIFTGQRGPENSTTLSQLMQANVDANPWLKGGGANLPQLPAYAQGTITPDGWTTADTFIAGDTQRPGVPNPEMIQTRVVNGDVQHRVVPLGGQVTLGRELPKFAGGSVVVPGLSSDAGEPDKMPGPWSVDTIGQPQGGGSSVSAPTLPTNTPDSIPGVGDLVGAKYASGNQYPTYFDPASHAYTPVAMGNWANPNAAPQPLWNWSSAYSDTFDPQSWNLNASPWVDRFLEPAAPEGQQSGIDPTTGRRRMVDNPGYGDPALSGTDQAPGISDTAEQGGFRRVTTAGRVHAGVSAPNAYVDVAPGDYIGRNDPRTGAPTVYRWDAAHGRYLTVPYAGVTSISTSEDWSNLPWDVRQSILDNQRFDYSINDTGIGSDPFSLQHNLPALTPSGRQQGPGWFAGFTGAFRPAGIINNSLSTFSPYGNNIGTVQEWGGEKGPLGGTGVSLRPTGLFATPTRMQDPAAQMENPYGRGWSFPDWEASLGRDPEASPFSDPSGQLNLAAAPTPRKLDAQIPNGYRWYEAAPGGGGMWLHENRNGEDWYTDGSGAWKPYTF